MTVARSRRSPMAPGIIAVGMTGMILTSAPYAHAGSAPDVVGRTYADASSMLSNAGFQPVVATTLGDRKRWSDCLVSFTSQRARLNPPNSGAGKTNLVLVSLNCDAAVASATAPGYSAQSPEGRAIAAASKS
jgi:hypothetical protein